MQTLVMDGVRRSPTYAPPVEALITTQPVIESVSYARVPNHLSYHLADTAEPVPAEGINWGRGVLFGLAGTVFIASAALAVNIPTRNHLAETPVKAAAINSVAESTAGKLPVEPTPPATPIFASTINNFVAKYPSASFGIIVKNLKTGETAGTNPDQIFNSASLYKLFVANQIYNLVDVGEVKLSDPAGDGIAKNISECLRVMINISDNACGAALGNRLGWDKQNASLLAQDYSHTDLKTLQRTSASDVGALLEHLYASDRLKSASNNQFVTFLKEQRVNNRLSRGLPVGTQIAHKTGDLGNAVHDAGIVYSPAGDYIIVVLSSWPNPQAGAAGIAELSSQIYHQLNP